MLEQQCNDGNLLMQFPEMQDLRCTRNVIWKLILCPL